MRHDKLRMRQGRFLHGHTERPTPDGDAPLTRRRVRLLLLTALALSLFALWACASPQTAVEITLTVDGTERTLTTNAATVNGAIKEAGVSLGDLDRITPPVWTELTSGMHIVVVRVREEFTTETQSVPYARRIIHDEALPAGESRLIQAGAEGVEELTYRIVSEDGKEVSRTLVKRTTATAPVEEILVVGAKGSLPPADIAGTLAYLSSGNAWVMRESSSGRRPLTSEGNLDGHVFSLSPDGRTLLFSRAGTGGESDVFNSLWVVTTTVKGEAPFPTGIENVLWAAWAPDGDAFAYSTAEPSASAPGWKAHNDLWIAYAPEFTATQVLSPTANIYYSWWGTTYEWAPDGNALAYANAGEVGLVNLEEKARRRLVQFPPFDSHSAWVWVPGVSWSPDGGFLATVVHRYAGIGSPEESPLFDLWIVSADGSLIVPAARDVGMWANPVWSPADEDVSTPDSAILFGVAENPGHSQLSLYDLYVMDRDGSNQHRVFPPSEQRGAETVDVAWSPDGDALVAVFQGDLYLLDPGTGEARQLTADGSGSHPRWAR